MSREEEEDDARLPFEKKVHSSKQLEGSSLSLYKLGLWIWMKRNRQFFHFDRSEVRTTVDRNRARFWSDHVITRVIQSESLFAFDMIDATVRRVKINMNISLVYEILQNFLLLHYLCKFSQTWKIDEEFRDALLSFCLGIIQMVTSSCFFMLNKKELVIEFFQYSSYI